MTLQGTRSPLGARASSGTELFAVLLLVLVAARTRLPEGLSVGLLAGVAFSPIWVPALRRFRGGVLLFGLGVVAVLSGLWLTGLAALDHSVSNTQTFRNTAILLAAITGIGVVLWARTVLPSSRVVTWLGVGTIIGIQPENEMFASNPWKFGIGVAVTVLLLALAQRTGRRGVELVAVLALAAVNAVSDARSAFGMLALAGLLVAWQMLPRARNAVGSGARVLVALVVIAAVVYSFGQALILDGALGEEAAERTRQQVDTSGSALVGGRPELGATLALMPHRPLGFGAGGLADGADIQVAKAGMASIGYDPDNGYVDNYMFGGQIEVHSVFGDLWARYGPIGLLFGAVAIVMALRGLTSRLATRTASALLIYVVVRAMWDFGFSPLSTSVPILILAVGLAAQWRDGQAPEADDTAAAKRSHGEAAPVIASVGRRSERIA